MVKYATKIGYIKPYTIPHLGPVPHLGREEGQFEGSVYGSAWVDDSRKTQYHWSSGLKPWERLHSHATMSSTRRNVVCKRPFEPKDELDFVLTADFDPTKELFGDKMDVYMQVETKYGDEMNLDILEKKFLSQVYYKPSNRDYSKLPNLREPSWKEPEKPDKPSWKVFRNRRLIIPERPLPRDHPIQYGGMTERRNIYSVKLGIAADHISQTNPGYSRTPSGSYYAI